jgi:hypothetical protein
MIMSCIRVNKSVVSKSIIILMSIKYQKIYI